VDESKLPRFSRPDPSDGSYDLTDPQSLNRYSYTENDPVNFTDPSGLMLCMAGDYRAECDISGFGGWGATLAIMGGVIAASRPLGNRL
jgi:hypothetical protein